MNSPYDDPYHLQGEVRFIEALGLGRAACATLGVRVSQAPIVHILAAGCQVAEGWADSALPHFADPEIAAVAPLVRLISSEQVLAAGLRYGRGGKRIVDTVRQSTASEPILGPTIDAGFYRKSALELVGDGLPVQLGDLFADLDVGLALRYAGFRAVLEPESAVFVDRLIAAESNGYQYGVHAERVWWRNLPASGRLAGLLLHCGTVAGEFLKNLPRPASFAQLVGRARAWFERSDYRLHYQLLDIAREQASTAEDANAAILQMPNRDQQPDDRSSARRSRARRVRAGGA